MQQKSENFSEFSERTEALARALGIKISVLPEKLGVSASMFHAYRSGKSPISPKAWRKLEAIERSAGLGKGSTSHVDFDPLRTEKGSTSHVDFDPLPESNAENSAIPNQFAVPSVAEFQRQMAEMNDKIQAALAAAFTIDELQRRMENAGAWPASAEDGKLSPGQLWTKYAPK
jgi:hypothetical protein